MVEQGTWSFSRAARGHTFVLLVAVFLVVGATDLRLLGVNVQMFRAESGLYLEAAFSQPAQRAEFMRRFVLVSYSGHFTPLAFALELLQARTFGVSETAWLARQVVLLALLGGALGFLVHTLLAPAGLSYGYRLATAFAASACYLLQPTLLDMFSWPFMGMQLACVGLAAAACAQLVTFARTLEHRALWWALLLGYGSMHACGVGAAISLGTLSASAILASTWLLGSSPEPPSWRNMVAPFAVAGGLTAVHLAAMAFLGPDGKPALPVATHLGEDLRRFAWLFMSSAAASLRSLWGGGDFTPPGLRSWRVDVIYGFGTFVLTTLGVGALWRRARRSRNAEARVDLVLVAFSWAALLVYCSMIVTRSRVEAPRETLLPFLFGSRYLIFSSFFLFVGLCALLHVAWGHSPALTMSALAGAFVVALVAHGAFARQLMPTLWPWTQPRQERVWSEHVAIARSEMAELGVVRDRSLADLDLEWKAKLSDRRALLEYALGCRGCARFEPLP